MPTSSLEISDYDQATDLLDNGKPAEAKSFLRSRLNGDGDSGLRMLLGIAEFRLERFETAESVFRDVVSARPDHDKAHYYIGLCRERQGRESSAADAFREALRVRPDFDLAQKKLEDIGATPAAEPSTSAADEPRMTELYIPRNEQELERYKDMREKKARADIWIEWRAKPLAARIFQIAMAVVVLGFILFLAFSMVFGGFASGPPPDF